MKLVVSIWLLVFGYFLWWGAVHPAWEGDSLAYHIPIARMIGYGTWMDKSEYILPWYYYPAMGETLLAGWMSVGLPVNWFNLFGWVVLTAAVYGFGRKMRLKRSAAVMAAVTVAMWPTVVRLINTQTADIWLAVWWVGAALKISDTRYRILEKLKNNLFWTGVFLGMMMGTKYSGILFALVLIVMFWDKLKLNIRSWLIPLLMVGGFWYVRNWILTGNPVYPLEISWLGFKGLPELTVFTGKPIFTLLSSPMLVIGALISEFLIWAGLILAPLWIRNKWTLIGMLNMGIYLLLPSRPENIVSDLRYTLVVFIPLLLVVWKKAQQSGRGELIAMAAVLGMIAEVTQLDYHPKVFFIIILILIGLYYFVNNTLSDPPLNLRGGRGS